jgi:hypothetical protein
MPVAYDVRDHGGLFAMVQRQCKAEEFTHLAKELFPDLEFEVRPITNMEDHPVPVVTLNEMPLWCVWVYPKGRPRITHLYYELGSKLGYLARLMAWPLEKYPLEVTPCGGEN